MNKTLLPVALAGALLASGCSFIPTLERPAAPVAEHYSAADEQAGSYAPDLDLVLVSQSDRPLRKEPPKLELRHARRSWPSSYRR